MFFKRFTNLNGALILKKGITMQREPTTSAFIFEFLCVLKSCGEVQLTSNHTLHSRGTMKFYI